MTEKWSDIPPEKVLKTISKLYNRVFLFTFFRAIGAVSFIVLVVYLWWII